MKKFFCDLCKKEVPETGLRNFKWFMFEAKEELCYDCGKMIWKTAKKAIKKKFISNKIWCSARDNG